jgi:CheY-like chemotaxis protein
MPGKPLKILIADDDIEDIELIEDAILNAEPSAELQKFTSGRTAIDHLHASVDTDLPCLIILDYSMPGITGSQVLSSIKDHERLQPIPKVVLSTSSAPRHMHECIANGANEYIVKPDNLKGMNALAHKLVAMCRQS